MVAKYIADLTEKEALVEADAILIGDSTVTGAGSGKKHSPKQSATASSVPLRTDSGQLKAADGIDNDDVVTVQQNAAESSKVVRLSRALAKDTDVGDTASIFADFKSQGFGLGSTDGIDEAKNDLELFNNFSRTSSGWRFNSRGQLEEVVAGIPRYNYNPATGEAEGILIEEQRTNSLPTQNLENWLKSGCTVSQSGQFAGVDSYLIDWDGTSPSYLRRQFPSGFVQGKVFSIFLKAGTINTASLRLDGSGPSDNVAFNLTTGEVGTVKTGYTAGNEYYGDGWWRCWVSFPNDTPNLFASVTSGSSEASGGSGTFFAALPQLEEGTQPSSPIITNGTEVTRTADIVARTLGAEFNPNAGTFVVEVGELPPTNSTPAIISLESTGLQNHFVVYALSGVLRARARVDGVSGTTPLIGAVASGDVITVQYSSAGVSVKINGGSYIFVGQLKADTISVVKVGTYGGGATTPATLNGSIKTVTYEPRSTL